MQINGAHLATAFAPKPLELQEQTRKPVTIDATASFKLDDAAASQVKAAPQAQQVEINVNEGQQARFVRFFSTSDELSSSTQKTASSAPPLPQGVQQYLQIAELQNSPTQSIVDEIV